MWVVVTYKVLNNRVWKIRLFHIGIMLVCVLPRRGMGMTASVSHDYCSPEFVLYAISMEENVAHFRCHMEVIERLYFT